MTKVFYRQLRALGHATYQDYLLSEHWQDVRGRFIRSGLWNGRCHGCRKLLNRPEVHHRTYARLGHERLHDLRGLCRDCHAAVHDLEKQRGLPLRQATGKALHKARRKMVTVR